MSKENEEKLWDLVFFIMGEEYPFSDNAAKIAWQERQSEVMRVACIVDRERVLAHFGERLRAVSEVLRGRNFKEARELRAIAFHLTASGAPDF